MMLRILIILLSGIPMGCINAESEVRTFTQGDNAILVSIDTQNPRNVPGEYRVQLAIVQKFKDGTYSIPNIWGSFPKKGFMDRVEYIKSQQAPILGVAKGVRVLVPSGAEGAEYFLLVRGISEPSEWRRLGIDKANIKPNGKLSLPDILSLPKISDDPLQKSLQQSLDDANQTYKNSLR